MTEVGHEPWHLGAVLVTGGTGLVGMGIARSFLKRGARTAIVGSSQTRADTARDMLSAHPSLRAFAFDLRSVSGVEAMFGRVEDELAPVSVLVNAAGINFAKPLAAVTEADVDELFARNVKAAFFASRIAGARMAAAGIAGRIVNVTSGNYRYVRPDAGLYSASKAALEMLTRFFALEFGPLGINVNAVAPGLVDRPGVTDPHFLRVRQYYLANSTLGRITTADDVGETVAMLASAQASATTGETVVIDGGFSAGRLDFPVCTQAQAGQ